MNTSTIARMTHSLSTMPKTLPIVATNNTEVNIDEAEVKV